MAKAFLKVVLVFIANIVGIILAPIDILIANAFPSISGVVNNITFSITYLWSMIYSYFYWFTSLFPTSVLSSLKVYVGILIATYTITLSIHLIIKIIKIIKNIKFW